MPKSSPDAEIMATLHPSGFVRSDSNFDSLSVASDGCLYYTLCSHHIDTHARVYRFDPGCASGPVCLGDLGEVVGEAGTRSIPQGKSHSPYFESHGKLYLATHYGYYKPSSNKEEPAETPPGYHPYPGGHFISYDMATGRFQELAKAPPGEGIITMHMDTRRGRLYGLTWPRGLFLVYDLAREHLANLGPVSRGGEIGEGESYFCLCRSFGIDPRDGSVYLTNADGEVLAYRCGADRIEREVGSLKRDVFGHWDPHVPGHQGYNWRKVLWHEGHARFYGVHPRSAYLFSFDPRSREVSVMDRIAAYPLLRSGSFEPFRYGYLGLALAPDGNTLYYLTGAYRTNPTGDAGAAREVLHLVTYSLERRAYADHGVVRLEDGRYPTMTHSIAIHPAGRIYTVPWIEKPEEGPDAEGRTWPQVDLVSIASPGC